MEDQRIVELYWERSEHAIAETAAKYGNYCYRIACNILSNSRDAEESVNDTWLGAWNAMPPQRPAILSTFLGKITRRISIDRWRFRNAGKRGGGEVMLTLEELEDCVSGVGGVEEEAQRREAARAVNAFLAALPATERRVFLRRYWYLDSIRDIAAQFGFSESKVTSMLHRTRAKLRKQLEKEGYL